MATGTGTTNLDIERGYAADDVSNLVHLVFFQRITANCGHGNGNFLQRFSLLTGNNRDDVAVIFRSHVLRHGRCSNPAKCQ